MRRRKKGFMTKQHYMPIQQMLETIRAVDPTFLDEIDTYFNWVNASDLSAVEIGFQPYAGIRAKEVKYTFEEGFIAYSINKDGEGLVFFSPEAWDETVSKENPEAMQRFYSLKDLVAAIRKVWPVL
jgi:hypothetical protein